MKMRTILIALLGAAFFFACSSPLDMVKAPSATKAGYGKVSIGFAGENGRTVYPSKVFPKYEYTFTDADNKSTVMDPVNGSFTLKAGTWTVTVAAYVSLDDSEPAATGSADFTLGSKETKVIDIKLEANETDGAGNFSLTLNYPAGAEVLSATLEPLPSFQPKINLTAAAGSTVYTENGIDAGYYWLTVLLKKTEGGTEKFAGTNEVIHIYDKLNSTFSVAFADVDFVAVSNEFNYVGTAMDFGWIVTYDSLSSIAATITGDEITITGYTIDLDIYDGGHVALESGSEGNDDIVETLKTMEQFKFTASGEGEFRVVFPTPETANSTVSYNHFGFAFTATSTPQIITVNIPTDLTQAGDDAGLWWGAEADFFKDNIEGVQFQTLARGAFNLTVSNIEIVQPIVIPPEPTETILTITGFATNDADKNVMVMLLEMGTDDDNNAVPVTVAEGNGTITTSGTVSFDLYAVANGESKEEGEGSGSGAAPVQWTGTGSYIIQLMVEDGILPITGTEDYSIIGKAYLYNGGIPFEFNLENPDFDIIPPYAFTGGNVSIALDQFQLVFEGVIGGSSSGGGDGPDPGKVRIDFDGYTWMTMGHEQSYYSDVQQNGNSMAFNGYVYTDMNSGIYGWAGMQANFGEETFAALQDAAGISFKAIGDGNSYRVMLAQEGVDGNHYTTFATTAGEETTVVVKFADLQQPDWGTTTATLDKSIAYAIEWQTPDLLDGNFALSISDVQFVSGENIGIDSGDWHYQTSADAETSISLALTEANPTIVAISGIKASTSGDRWAQLQAFPHGNSSAETALQNADAIQFKVKGDGNAYKIELIPNDQDVYNYGYAYYEAVFTTNQDGSEKTITLFASDFALPSWSTLTGHTLDMSKISGLQWTAAIEDGPFNLSVSGLEIEEAEEGGGDGSTGPISVGISELWLNEGEPIATIEGSGYISDSLIALSKTNNDTLTFTVTNGYTVVDWSVGTNVVQNGGDSYTITTVNRTANSNYTVGLFAMKGGIPYNVNFTVRVTE